jgi:myosin-5
MSYKTDINSLVIDTPVHVEVKRSNDDGFTNKYSKAIVQSVNKSDSKVTVQLCDNDQVLECKINQVFMRNPDHQLAVDDITALSYLHEPALLENLQIRYMKNLIYTYTGSILIAINPYQRLSEEMYGKDTIEIYRGVPMGKLSPHVYAMAEDCFSHMMREGKNQSILVSGESGAGKTEVCNYYY